MNKKSKILLISLSAVVLIAASIFGTVAYLTDTSSAVNTFTVGNVNIELDEAKVNPDGTKVEGAARVTENKYHLIPGQIYVKDPTMTIKADSEPSYVRMLVTVDSYKEWKTILGNTDLVSIFSDYDKNTWILNSKTVATDENTITYEFRYKDATTKSGSDVKLDALFGTFTVPGTMTKEQLKSVGNFNIIVVGHAIQAAGFDDANEAWAAFDAQVNNK